jgi:hypothetical protein
MTMTVDQERTRTLRSSTGPAAQRVRMERGGWGDGGRERRETRRRTQELVKAQNARLYGLERKVVVSRGNSAMGSQHRSAGSAVVARAVGGNSERAVVDPGAGGASRCPQAVERWCQGRGAQSAGPQGEGGPVRRLRRGRLVDNEPRAWVPRSSSLESEVEEPAAAVSLPTGGQGLAQATGGVAAWWTTSPRARTCGGRWCPVEGSQHRSAGSAVVARAEEAPRSVPSSWSDIRIAPVEQANDAMDDRSSQVFRPATRVRPSWQEGEAPAHTSGKDGADQEVHP